MANGSTMLKKVLLGGIALLVLLAGVIAVVGWQLSVDLPEENAASLAASPQFADGRFHNQEPQRPFTFELSALEEQFFGTQVRVPPGPVPVVPVAPERLAQPVADGLRVIWLGHSSVIVEIDGLRVLIDGVLSERASPFGSVGPARFHPPPIALDRLAGIDVAVHSHNHYDHLDRPTVLQLARGGTLVLVPLGMAAEVVGWGVPAGQVREMDWFDEQTIKGVRVVATPARHYSGRGLFDYKMTLWASWTLIGPEHRVFYSGDSGYTSAFADIGKRFGPFDLDIIKVGSYGPGGSWIDIHMPVEAAVQAHLDVGGKHLLPVHWGTFNLAYHDWDEPIRRTIRRASEQGVSLLTPLPGEEVEIGVPRTFTRWWETVVAAPR